LWCTNGTKAELLVVMCKTARRWSRGRKRKQITAFIVETNSPGFSIEHRCQFMGLRGIGNGLLKFDNVFRSE